MAEKYTDAELDALIAKLELIIDPPAGNESIVKVCLLGFPTDEVKEAVRARVARERGMDPDLVQIWTIRGADEVEGEADPYADSYHGNHTALQQAGMQPSEVPLATAQPDPSLLDPKPAGPPAWAPKSMFTDDDFK